MLIIPRQRPRTAISRGGVIVPNRPKMGPRFDVDEGPDYTVTLTGPSDQETVRFSSEAGKLYRVFWTVLSSTAEIVTPEYNTLDRFLFTPGTFLVEEGKKGPGASDVQPYGHHHRSLQLGPTEEDSTLTLTLMTAAEAPAEYSITVGNFYVREVK